MTLLLLFKGSVLQSVPTGVLDRLEPVESDQSLIPDKIKSQKRDELWSEPIKRKPCLEGGY